MLNNRDIKVLRESRLPSKALMFTDIKKVILLQLL